MIKYIIFDFDGTIADTIEIIKKIAETNFDVSRDDFELLKDKGLKNLLIKKKISFLKLSELKLITFPRLRKNSNIKLFPGILELIDKLKDDYKLGIISSNSKENIFKTLKENKIENFFEFVYSNSSFFGKHLVLKKMCEKYKIDPNTVIYVGDEDRDIIAAKKLNIKNIAVTWGFNSEKRLNKVAPNFIAKTPMQILEYIV